MIFMKRNLREIHYCIYSGEENVLDSEGYETGEKKLTYEQVQSLTCNVGAATGEMALQLFGATDPYDKIIMTDNMDVDIDETTVLFVDKDPEYNADGTPIYDYTVKRCAETLNHKIFAVKKAQ